MITLFGATGQTGRLIAEKLDRENLLFRVAGRSANKLHQLSNSLNSKPIIVQADATLPETLPALFKDTRVLINCAGPFTDIGERVASLAAVSGVHYIDTTNELGYVYRLRTYDQIARQAYAILLPSCAFEVALADCAASLLAETEGLINAEFDVAYHIPAIQASRGTRLSALRSLATSWLGYQSGAWGGLPPGSKRKRFQLHSGWRQAVNIPSSEIVTFVPHLSPKTVRVWVTTSATAAYLAPIFLPLFASFLRSLPGRSVLWAAGLNRPAGDPGAGQQGGFEILINAADAVSEKKLSVTGHDPYRLTAEIVVYTTRMLAEQQEKRGGILSPAQFLNSRDFFRAARAWGVRLDPDLLD